MAVAVSVWGTRHLHALVSSAGHLARNTLATVLTTVVMALALALPLSLSTLVDNARAATGDFADAIGLSVYFKQEVSEQRARQLAHTASERPGVASATLITAAQGLEEFRKESGFGAALDALTDNPLPHVLTVRPRPEASSPAEIESLRRYLAAWPEVDSVQLDSDWVTRFNAILNVLRQVLVVAVVLLGAGVIAVVGNTIRLEIVNRRAEIEVTKLVGGTNAFVRRPFLYTGVLYGLVAALLAWAIVAGAVGLLGAPVAKLAQAYGSHFALQAPGWAQLRWLLAGAPALGWMGSWLAAAGQLARIEPRSS
jgi:cell division transport system permease protein